jgi:hypothetical protein
MKNGNCKTLMGPNTAAKKQAPGRKPIDPSLVRSHLITIRLRDIEYNMLSKLSKESKMSHSEFLRHTMSEWIEYTN